MSLEKLVEKILADARAEAEQIVLRSREKADEIREAARKEGKEKAASILAEAEREARLQSSRILSQAKLEKKLRVLEEKRKLLEEVLTQALGSDQLRHVSLKKKIIAKDGEQEEVLRQEQFREELRSRLECDILDLLRI